MSGRSYGDYKKDVGTSYESLRSEDPGARQRAEEARRVQLKAARERIHHDPPPPPKQQRKADEVYDPRLARNAITSPAEGTKTLHIVLVDNSGSNTAIATHLRNSSGWLLSALGMIDSTSQMATIYFSDHCDGAKIRQDVDYVSPTQEGDKILHSSIAQIRGADGGDAPEAIECALMDACRLNFGGVQKPERHLYLVTDVVAHGMGLTPDTGCPHGVKWQDSLQEVAKAYGTFNVIGCGGDKGIAKLQQKFVPADRVHLDVLDLSQVPTAQHRRDITGNALLFLIARSKGLQTLEAFLMTLYGKWLSEPIFGSNTDLNAREAITRFVKFVDLDEASKEAMLERIFAA